jgi:hypothetical protein
MIKVLVFVFLALSIFVTGCKKEAIAIDASKVCAVENEKKYVVTSGFLDGSTAIYCSNTGGRMDCSLDLVGSPGGKRIFGAEIEQGTGADEIEKLPDSYKKDDIKIHDNSGGLINMSNKVTLTGQMSIAPDGSVCFMEVDKIEK